MSYRIGSFNMRNFSLSAASKRDLERIARIINGEKLDIVALQEVLSEGKGLGSLKNRLRGNWTYCCPRQETRARDNPYLSVDERGEAYAFLWNTDRVELLLDEKAQPIEPKPWHTYKARRREGAFPLIRDPLYGRFKVKGQNIELRLITTHIIHGKPERTAIEPPGGPVGMRRNEFNILAGDIYPRIADDRRNVRCLVPYTILLGDYNLNLESSGIHSATIPDIACFDERGRRLEGVLDGPRVIYTVQERPTTVGRFDYANNYDHFSYDRQVKDRQIVRAACPIDAAHRYAVVAGQSEEALFADYRDKVSDHVPIVIEIEFK